MKKLAAIIMMTGWMSAQNWIMVPEGYSFKQHVYNSFFDHSKYPKYFEDTVEVPIESIIEIDECLGFIWSHPTTDILFVDSLYNCYPPDTVDYNDPQWRFKEWHLGEGWGTTIEQAYSMALDSAHELSKNGYIMAEFTNNKFEGGFGFVEDQVSKAYIYTLSDGYRIKLWMRRVKKN